MVAIPVIDYSKLKGEEKDATMAEIAKACEEWGFFQLVNHPIPLEFMERVKKVSDDCYKEEKEEGFFKSKPVQIMNNLEVDGEEAVKEKLKDLDWEDVIELNDDTVWPTFPEFTELLIEYMAKIKDLTEELLEVIDENIGLEKGYLKKAFVTTLEDKEGKNLKCGSDLKPYFGTKVSHYPPCPHPHLATGLRAHTDGGGLILLFQDSKDGGLQFLMEDGYEDVDIVDNCIIVNTGDQLEAYSNGKYKSRWHRIRVMGERMRTAITCFYNPAKKAIVGPAPYKEGVEPDREVAKYPTYFFEDYAKLYNANRHAAKEPRFKLVKTII